MIQFLVAYLMTFAVLIYFMARDGSSDVLFSPWPGFTFIFGSYFLVSSLAFEGVTSDLQWTLYSLAIAGFFLGSVASRMLFPLAVRKVRYIDHDRDSFVFNKTLNFPAITAMVIIALACTAAMMARSGPPILAENVDAARVAYLDNGYLGELAAMLDVGAVFAVAYLLSFRGRAGSNWKRLSAATIIVLFIIVAVLAGSRSRLLKVAVPTIFLFHFFRNGISIRTLLVTGSTGAFFIGFLGYFRNLAKYGNSLAQGIGGQASDWNALDYTLFFLRKELANGAFGLSEVIRAIPTSAPYQQGLLHLAPLVSPFGFKIPNPGDFFKSVLGGTWDGFGLAATFIAPMYADFGIIGVFSLSIVYAFLLTTVYLLTRGPRAAAAYWACVYAMLFYVMVSGMRSDMVSFEAVWFCLIAILLRVVSYRRTLVNYLNSQYSLETVNE